MSLLVTSEHKLQWKLDIKFTFDDGIFKSVTLDKDLYVLIKFRRNDNVYYRAGRIVDVVPIMLDTQPVSYTGGIIVDFSGQYNASRIQISACDILNIRICSRGQLESLAPTYRVEEKMFEDSYIIPSVLTIGGSGVGSSGVGEAAVY